MFFILRVILYFIGAVITLIFFCFEMMELAISKFWHFSRLSRLAEVAKKRMSP